MNEDSKQRIEPGLYVVATPIGNLSDLGRRACDILKEVDLIACEDTRVSRVLLDSIGVHARTIAAHEHNERDASSRIVAALEAGLRVALVCDAGTPAISDPGAVVVATVRAAGHRVVPVPGACAVTTLLSVAAFGEGGYCFAGFVPSRRRDREAFVSAARDSPRPTVFFESPHRIGDTLAAIQAQCEAERRLVLGRELTKRFEEIADLRVSDALAWLEADPNRMRGEYVIALAAAPARPRVDPGDVVSLGIDALLAALMPELGANRSARLVQGLTGGDRRALYARALALKPDDDGGNT
ncbi:MAG: 16S rRNA (cytidine(1402)-2'-O)-methyltransferase [Burkholderiaceae bacterium]